MFVAISLVVAAFPNLVYAIVKPVSAFSLKTNVRYRPYGIATLVLLAIWLLLFAYGMMYGRFRYEVNRIDYRYDGPAAAIPQGFDGYRIVVISDLHLDGWKGHEDKLREILDTVNRQNADVVFFTGDLVSLDENETDGFAPLLSRIKARDGVISVMGNHDYMPYNGVPPFHSNVYKKEEIEALQRVEREDFGWKLLLNQNTIIRHGGDSIAILGCENQSMGVHSIIQRGNLSKAMQGTDGMFRILLTHDPSHWDGEVVGRTDIPLTISGHTHAGQVNIYGISPAGLALHRLKGQFRHGSQTLYVNSGLGAAMPMRIGATPEITVITLRH